MDGFTMIEKVENRDFNLIFTTAHDEFALKAIKVSCFEAMKDYEIAEISPNVAVAITDIEVKEHQFIAHYEKTLDIINNDFDNLMAGYALEEDARYDRDGDVGFEYNPETETMDGR